MMTNIDICYLCGKEIIDDSDQDHVPPKQFFPKQVRKKEVVQLVTLPTHKTCNGAYCKDEEYFFHSVGPLSLGSYAGNRVWENIAGQMSRPEGRIIHKMILSEFEAMPSGIFLPPGIAIKRVDGKRAWRVIWKIIRGLHLIDFKEVLPQNTHRFFQSLTVNEPPPSEFSIFAGEPSYGNHKGIFAYKRVSDSTGKPFRAYSLLLWDKVIVIVAFHTPPCGCDLCNPDSTSPTHLPQIARF